MQRPTWLRWPNTPGASLGVFLTLGVVAVGLITWVGVSASHRQASQTSAAVAQGQGLADPILQLCGQGGDVALRLQGAGLCDAAQNVKADPVAPPPTLTGPQIQTMIDNAVRNRVVASPPPTTTAPATPTPQQIQDMINSSIDSHRPPAPVQASAPTPRQQPAPPPYYPPPAAPQYQQPAYQQPQYPNYPPAQQQYPGGYGGGYPRGNGPPRGGDGWPSGGGGGNWPPPSGGGGSWPPTGGSGGTGWPGRGGGGYPGQPPYQYPGGYPGGYGGGYPYPAQPSYPSYPQQPYPYPQQPSYPQPRPQPVERGGGGRQSGGGLLGGLGVHIG